MTVLRPFWTRWIAVIALMLVASPAQAYWEYGHETVARIAMLNVRPEVRAKVLALLARATMLETPTCPARTPEQASVWPDCVKTLGQRFSYAYSWHYQNVNICKPFELKTACKDGNCVSAQITRDMALLKDPKVPARERLQALIFLIHFVGDLAQPLHAGDRGDLGGNQAKSDYGLYGPDKLNLHSIWDGYLAERAISTPPALVRGYSPTERATAAAGTVEDWSRDSWQVARDTVYASAFGDPCVANPPRAQLADATIAKLVGPARDQIIKGGLRLARLLDEAFG